LVIDDDRMKGKDNGKKRKAEGRVAAQWLRRNTTKTWYRKGS
jgi:hypothetical protein